MLVVDSSIARCGGCSDEATPATDALLERVRNEGGVVPVLWRWEVANVLSAAVRRGRLSLSDVSTQLALLSRLPVSIDAEAPARAWRESLMLAQAHALTVYDAAYLEIAGRLGVDLATKDLELAAAARAVGVRIVP